MLDISIVREAASRLKAAQADRVQIRQLHLEYHGMDVADAYAIQRQWVRMKLDAGARVLGHKVGFTSKAKQASVGIAEPDFGVLLDDMLFANAEDIAIERFIEPRVEIELAFVLGSELRGPRCTPFDVTSATKYIVPAMEIIDSRIQRVDPGTGETRTIVDSVSDNAANAGIVLGCSPVRPTEVDMRWVAALLYRNGQIEETGVAAAVLNHPAKSVAWLANKLSEFDEILASGEVILSGAFTQAIFGRRGDTFHADYGPLGTVSFRLI